MKDPKIGGLLVDIPQLRFVPALALCLFLIAVLGFLDYGTGTEISFSIFYLLPVTLSVLVNGRNLGLLVAVVSASVWLFADIEAGAIYSSFVIPFWNALVRLGYFVLNCLLLERLKEMIKTVKDLSLRDPLTKAANWRFFEEYSNTALRTAIRDKEAVTLAYMDMDNFKSLNDRLGHAVGDEALVLLVETIRNGIRPADMIARLGGDEFVLLLPGPDFDSADEVLRRLHTVVSKAMADRGWETTTSVGAMTFTSPGSEVGELLAHADKLMYEVKKQGKNALLHNAWP